MPRYSENKNIATGKVAGMLVGVEDVTKPVEEDRMQQMVADKLLFKSEVKDNRTSSDIDIPASANSTKLNKDEIDIVNGVVGISGSVLKKIKDNAENADFTDTSGLASLTLANAINEIYAEKAVASGLASLDATGKVPASQLPVSAMEFKGAWDASTEAYPVSPNTGDYYIISVAGTIGGVAFDVGDAIVYDGTNWQHLNKVEIAEEISLTSTLYTATNVKLALEEIAGTGRVNETVKGNADAIDTHIADVSNPHAVTKANVGLGNVDNTSDADKPVSDAQDLINDEIKGVGWTDETVKGNADDIDTLEADVNTAGSVLKSINDNAEDAVFTPVGGIDAVTIGGALGEVDARVTAIEGFNVTSWAEVQNILREGIASNYFTVGDQFVIPYNGVDFIWNVIALDHPLMTPVDTDYTHTLALQPQGVLMNAQFSAPQAIYGSTEELAIGTHVFILNGVKYQVTTTVAMPANGVLVGGGWTGYIPSTMTVYGADRVTVLESGLSITVSTEDVTLAEVNNHVRCRYGSNNPVDNALRQFLNSNASVFNWEPQGLYDMPSSYAGTGGFLYQLDPELVAVLGEVENKVALASYDGGGQVTVQDKAFLLSRVEVGFGTEGVTTDESVYEFYDGATNAERIKLLSGSPRYWWLRSPNVSYTYIVRYVHASGGLGGNSALNSNGLSPVCVIV